LTECGERISRLLLDQPEIELVYFQLFFPVGLPYWSIHFFKDLITQVSCLFIYIWRFKGVVVAVIIW